MGSASMSLTLALLEGPTKAAVASTISAAGLGSVLLGLSPNIARCFTYREPYDDDVFKKLVGDTEGLPDFSAIFTTESSSDASYTKDLRPIGSEAFAKLTSTKNLGLTLFRNVAMSTLIAINRYLTELYDAEEAAAATGDEPEYPPFPRGEIKESVYAGAFNACLDWATQIVRSLFDWAAAVKLSLPLSRRVRKVLRASAIRKSRYPFYKRTLRVVKTSLFSESTLYMADWVVSCCMEAYAAMRKPAGGRPLGPRLRLLGLRCSLQAGRCTAVWIAISIGNGVGSAAPGKTRTFAMFLSAQLAGMGVNIYANAFIARLTAGVPPPGGPPPVIGPPVPPAMPPNGAFHGEPAERAAAGDDLRFPLGPGAPLDAPAGPEEQEADNNEAGAPLPPEAPNVHEGRRVVVMQRRVVGGPRLPNRRPQRRQAPVAAVAAHHGAMGPDTPQAARDPPRVVADVEEHAEGEGVDAVGVEHAAEGELVLQRPLAGNGAEAEELLGVVEVLHEGENNLGEEVGGLARAPMPPATPPMAEDPALRE